ncbi:hypothetical protein GCM10023183_26900 [Nibribacter koreensis]|uniref:Uncharacterized protein n=2 Tax=Nibribacter koreensis TaxID=1084519 RepID=A0ABP8FS79_9BACT
MNQQEKEVEHDRLNVAVLEDRFKFKNLAEFSIDTLDWEERNTVYQKLDSLSFFQIHQDTSPNRFAQYDDLSENFFHSKQSGSRGLIEFTILSQSEGEYCDQIDYSIFSKEGRLISRFKVAGSCGDGGYYETAFGRFINDSAYELLSEDNYKSEDALGVNTITYKRTLTNIKHDGTIVQSDTVLKESIK